MSFLRPKYIGPQATKNSMENIFFKKELLSISMIKLKRRNKNKRSLFHKISCLTLSLKV